MYIMVLVISTSTNRALGVLICKYKAVGSMQYTTFPKLYDTMVWSVISYGASIWGQRHVSAKRGSPSCTWVNLFRILLLIEMWDRFLLLSDNGCVL